ncbi:MAG TPA: hypothetical protein VET85_13835 [Stellaceae bacterium]|nr:hypothetical protein [Stellaceae bacterium]
MSGHFSRPVPGMQTINPHSKFCDQAQTIVDIGQKLGVSLSQDEINQLVQAIAAGGPRGMAVALSIADSIAAANYQLTPQLVTQLTNRLNKGNDQSLNLSYLLKAKLRSIRIPR